MSVVVCMSVPTVNIDGALEKIDLAKKLGVLDQIIVIFAKIGKNEAVHTFSLSLKELSY